MARTRQWFNTQIVSNLIAATDLFSLLEPNQVFKQFLTYICLLFLPNQENKFAVNVKNVSLFVLELCHK